MPLEKEPHGTRPKYPPGTLVRVRNSVGVVVKADTNIDGAIYDWADKDPVSRTLSVLNRRRLGHSHAWRPEYSIDWIENPDNLRCAWWCSHEWDSAEVPPALHEFNTPWPKLEFMAAEGNCAKALADQEEA